jgi:tRNA A37 methylthiotransferase MiaB
MEATWLVERGVREIFLVSENSSSYGKDLGDIRLLERLLCELSELERLSWIRVSYLQPAEMRPSLIEVMTSTPESSAVLRPVIPTRRTQRAAPDAALR